MGERERKISRIISFKVILNICIHVYRVTYRVTHIYTSKFEWIHRRFVTLSEWD